MPYTAYIQLEISMEPRATAQHAHALRQHCHPYREHRPLILTDICVLTLSLISADTCSLLEGTTRILLSEALGAILLLKSNSLSSNQASIMINY
jgi:hypothetical protein